MPGHPRFARGLAGLGWGAAPQPTQAELQRLLHAIATRVTRALEKQGLLLRDEETSSLDLEPADGFEDRGQVVYRLKHPFRDGATHVVLDPIDFIARLAALVPRPRAHLTRYHGVFAPNCKLGPGLGEAAVGRWLHKQAQAMSAAPVAVSAVDVDGVDEGGGESPKLAPARPC